MPVSWLFVPGMQIVNVKRVNEAHNKTPSLIRFIRSQCLVNRTGVDVA